MIATGKTIRQLRELLPAWHAQRPDGYEITIAPSGTHAVAVAAGDAATGTLDSRIQPSNRSAKGHQTRRAVERNQPSFYAHRPDIWEVDPTANTDLVAAPTQTWILLFLVKLDDVDGPEIRFEFSLPAQIERGYVTRWRERIVFPPIQDIGDAIAPGPAPYIDDDAFDAEDFSVAERLA